MLNIIIGKRSNLSRHLNIALDNCLLISSQNMLDELNQLNWKNIGCVNIIMNQFHPAFNLHNILSPEEYISNSIVTTSVALQFFKKKGTEINKLIYSSSSAVYGQNKFCTETDSPRPQSLYASLKLANEYLIEKFCTEEDIDYVSARIFNMYGGNDQFSIISKLIHAINNNLVIDLINNGSAVRDFIHVDDVVAAYKGLLEANVLPPIVNIATGSGRSISSILNFIRENGYEITSKNIQNNEIQVSIADISILVEICGLNNFRSLEHFLLDSLKK